MANTARVTGISRPDAAGFDANGESGRMALADYLLVRVDRYDNTRVVRVLKLAFADYAGLEAEYVAQAATTVLQAAVETAVGAEDWTTEDQLSSAQRAFIDVQITIS